MQLFRRTVNGIGVDFGTSTVKVVELTKTKAGLGLVTYAIATQGNLLVDGRTPDAVARTTLLLRAMFQRAGVSRGTVAAALPILSVFSTVLELPWMPERELDAAVKFAARSYVPSPLADVVLGWTRIGPPTDAARPVPPPTVTAPPLVAEASPLAAGVGRWAGTPPEALGNQEGEAPRAPKLRRPQTRKVQEVFLTAAPRESVARYTAVFERLEVPLGALEVESFPLARSLLRGESRPVLLVDFGGRTTSYSVVDEGYLRINQALDVGGEALTEAIARKLALRTEDAERKKRTEGVQGSEATAPAAAALRPVLSEMVGRGETVRRLYERKRGRPLGKIVLIGGGARLPGLPGFWSSVTGLPTEVGNPWREITVPSPLTERLSVLGPAFAVAVGLALRSFAPTR